MAGGFPTLEGDEVHAWLVGLDAEDARLEAPSEVLSDEEKERAAGFRHEARRHAFLISRAALRVILAGYTGVEAAKIRIRTAPGGKPELESGDLRFNLSHSGALAACVVAHDRAVGVDIERVRPAFDYTRIVERFFSDADRAALDALEPDAAREEFFRRWTRREAYLKANGESVFGATDGDVPHGWTLRDLALPPGYVGTVAAEGLDLGVKSSFLSSAALPTGPPW